MATAEFILRLHAAGWPQRRIARELHVSRDAVSRYVRLGQCGGSKPANAPLGSAADALPAAVAEFVRRPSSRGRQSECELYRDAILAMLRQGLMAQRIYQDLVTDHGFPAKYWSVRRFVRRLTGGTELPVRRMEVEPGQEAQVDFGTGAPIIMPGQTARGAPKQRKTNVFRMVLSHSRKGYSEATYTQTAEDFIRCLENAFAHFGGVPRTLVIDNLKAAVSNPDWFDPELNPKLQSFCQHYGTVILPTRPRTPEHKGKVESGVKYVKNNALKARKFASLEEENRFLLNWETTVADQRIHGTTRLQVGKVFQEMEKSALMPVPLERFPFFHEAERKVNRDGHIEVARAYYSVPPEYLGNTVWARWDMRVVRVFNRRWEQIAMHVRREAGRFSTLGEHIHPRKISGLERGAEYLLDKVRRIGGQSHQWAQAMLSARGIEGTRVLQGLLSLTKKHDAKTLEKACETALSHGAFRLRTLRRLLQRQSAEQEVLPFLDEHPIIRPLDDYAQVVAVALERGAAMASCNGAAGAAAPRRWERHGWTKESPVLGAEKDPDPHANQGPAEVLPPRSEYPLSGCSPANTDSVSPDSSIVVFSSSLHQEP